MLKLIQWYKIILKNIVLLIFILSTFTYGKKDLIESQPEILFNYDKLKKKQDKFRLQIQFNKAILLLEKGEYKKAISSFKDTSKILKIPSFLNIGIAYYKLKQYENATLYLNNIYEYKEAAYSHTYSYISACYYLYQIKKERIYLETIIEITKKFKNLTEHSQRLLVDTFIILKDYSKALDIIKKIDSPMNLKKSLLYLKLKNYEQAEVFLNKAKNETFNQSKIDLVLWLMIYRDLKSNELEKLLEHIDELNNRKEYFTVNQKYPLKIFFNKNKYTAKQYLSFVTKFDKVRKINFLMYFAPFIFSDNEEILYDISKGFIFKNKQNVDSLEQMVEYNSRFIDIINDDPIERTLKLKAFIREDSNAYMYYNLALCYAQINDFNNAFKYFSKAYKLNPGNKLYSVMTLITSNVISKKLSDSDYMEDNITSKKGMYKYFGQMIYKIFLNQKFDVKIDPTTYSVTIFYKALDYLVKLKENKITIDNPLFVDHYKDPLVYLLKATFRRQKENDFTYFSRLQDTIPLKFNNSFITGSFVVTQYYTDLLKAIGLFDKADLYLEKDTNPSYLQTKVLMYLYKNEPKKSAKLLDFLRKKYKLEDKYTMYLVVATLLEEGKYNEALLQISLIKAIYKDADANFISGVQLIQDLKLNSASQYFVKPYMESFIDFKITNFDRLLESL